MRSRKEQAGNQLQVLQERESGLKRESENYQRQLENIQADLAKTGKSQELEKELEELALDEDDINKRMLALEEEVKKIKNLINARKEELDNRRDNILSENLNSMSSSQNWSREGKRAVTWKGN